MPNKQAAIKDLRKNKRRAAQNARVKTNVKSLFKKAKAALSSDKKEGAKELVTKFQQAVDKAVKIGVLNKNTASRKKSSLMGKVAAK